MANARAETDLETGRTAQAMGATKQRSPEISTFEALVERKPVEPAFSDDLDLDAILNEFK